MAEPVTAAVTSRPGMRVRYSYLPQQFQDSEEILAKIREHLATCNFTLGPEVDQFERSFAKLIGTRFAIGVGSGTDALSLSLRALGVGYGDEVITAANTFIATVGAIHATGARPILVDVTPDFTIDPKKIEAAITPRTRAILPVHLTGEAAEMDPILELGRRRNLLVVEDAAQAIGASYQGKNAGTLGIAAGFSLHPLKNLNVWGDAGVVVTSDEKLSDRLRLLRNHGLKNRDEVEILGFNSRLDSIQAIVGNWLIGQVSAITKQRIENAAFYDQAFERVDGITLPPRRRGVRHVFHLYQIYARDRDALFGFLLDNGVEAKIHYPIALPLQKGLAYLGYKKGDFPETERQSASLITLPVDQYLSRDEQEYVAEVIRKFYRNEGRE